MEAVKIINTVKYMTPRQWKYRLYYMARKKTKRRKPKLPAQNIKPMLIRAHYGVNIRNRNEIDKADCIIRNQIPTISGITVHFNGDWDLKNIDYRLVCFRLNSFRWLLYLSDAFKATGNREYIEKGFSLIEDWWVKNGDLISGDKWNAYVLAERLQNWICFCSEYCGNEINKYVGWIHAQAQELKESIEFQLGANHLLSEGKALIYAGAFLRNDKLYEYGKKILIDEAKEQFLPDGGHYERSISYHVESLQQYFESYAVMTLKSDPDSEVFVELMKKPYCFLNGMIGVDGKIPLFNDAAYDYPFYNAVDFLSTAAYIYSPNSPKGIMGNYSRRWSYLETGTSIIEWITPVKYDNTGFVHYPYELNGRKFSFFMDCGDNGPDYNLGHTHADALSILLHSENKEILIDSGVFTYKPGKERDECRSTRAHNTVELQGSNSAEIWSAFRVARRGHTKIIDFADGKNLLIRASHDGYTKCLGVKADHFRLVEINPEKGNLIISDKIDTKKPLKAISRYHVGKACSVMKIDDLTCIIDGSIKIQSDAPIRVVECNMADSFGIMETTKCIEIDFNKETTTIFTIK